MLRSKISSALENNSFAAPVTNLKTRRKRKEEYMEVEESKTDIGLQES